MAVRSRSPHVIGTQYFSKYGYDVSLEHVSRKLTSGQDAVFWKHVVDVLDELRAADLAGRQDSISHKNKAPAFTGAIKRMKLNRHPS
ncbi:hypothetical protein [Terasakiella sp. SH-1]|uniref:hypothetical protein n=1 Tax=Terasakiella sp. SH-1 TaxID=2560057 RepID=UPI0010733095|nr:hypothetical protein [Terasakiella sp. SH-1]